jgi:hypothetical protein
VRRNFEERVDDACARWIARVDERPGLVALACLVVSLLLGAYAATTLGVNADPDALIRADLPWRQAEEHFRQTFHTFDEAILAVIDADSASSAARAADALAERLAQRTDLYSLVDVPGGGEFFRRNVLLYLDRAELERFSDRLAAVQPFLGELTRDPSVVGVSRLLALALAAQRDGVDVGMDLAAALDRVSVAAEAAADGRAAPDPWGDALIGGSLSEAARHRVVSLEPRQNFDELLGAGPAIEAVRAAAAELGLDREHGVRVRVTGDTPLNYDEQIVVQRQGQIVGVVSFVLFSVIVFVALRSPRLVLALVGSVLASVLWTNAFAAFAVGHLNQVSAAFNVLIIGLGGEFGIHVCMRYRELLSQGRSRADALVEMGRTMGSSLVSSAGTTAIGFYVFLPTDYRGVAELGLIAGTGVLLSLVSSFTVLPALLSLGAPEQPRAPVIGTSFTAKLQHLPLRYAAPIRWAAAAVAIASAALLPRAAFDHNPVNLRDPSTESVQAFEDLLARSTSTPWTADATAPGVADARALAERLRALPVVGEARTISDYVPADQDEKLAILEEAALFLPPLAPPAPPPDAAAQHAALGSLAEELARAEGGESALAASAARLRAALRGVLARSVDDGPEAARVLALLRTNVVGSLPEQLGDLQVALTPSHVTLDDLPRQLRDQMLAPDGRARVEIRPRDDLSDSDTLEEFVDTVRTVAPRATGSAVSLLEWGRVTSGAMQDALLAGMVATALFLFLLWRRLWDTLLAFFPLALAAMLTCAVMVLAGLRFNFANVIVLPMLLGMGIDNGVHLVHRHRTNPDEVDVLSTSTARAVFFSAVTTVLSFGSLAFASHRGMAALGQVLTIGVASTLVCYVVVLPAVLEWDDRRTRARSAAAPREETHP